MVVAGAAPCPPILVEPRPYLRSAKPKGDICVSLSESEGVMSLIERVLEPDSTETPTCKCGKDMRLVKIEPRSEEAETRDFDCNCGRRMVLAVRK